MPKKKQQKEKNGKPRVFKKKSLPRRPGNTKEGMFLSKLDTVEHLVKKYGMTNIDAMITFDKFFKNYPSGEITKEEFMEEYKDNVMAEAFFKMFDEDGNGTLSFYEYIMVKTAPRLDEPEEKLKWLFGAFDKDGGGTIDDDEVYGVVVALFKMLNRESEEENIDDIVDDILDKVDANGDGVISQQEFVHHAMESSFLAELIENHTNTKPTKK